MMIGKIRYRNHDYEAIVIGAGIGGLSAGAFLARKGVKVLLCEMHDQPGGYLTSFKRRGYTFDGGIQGLQEGGFLFPFLRSLGLLDRVKFHKCKYGMGGSDFFLPLEKVSDVVTFYRNLREKFPGQAEGLDKIAKDAEDFCNFMFSAIQVPNPIFVPWKEVLKKFPGWYREHKSALKCTREFFRLMKTPMDDYFRQYVNDPDLLRLLNQLSYTGSPAPFALIFITFLMDYYYPQGGVQTVPDLLAEYIAEHGGEIRYKTLVEEIIMEKGRARGVRLKGGKVIRAPFIISNSDARRTYLEMLPAEVVPEDYRRGVREGALSEAFFAVYLGVDIPPEEIKTQGCSHVIYWPDYKGINIEDYRWTQDVDLYDNAPIVINCNSIGDPTLAPPGKSAMTLMTIAYEEFADYWGTKNGKRTQKYKELKNQVADKLIATAEKTIPGLTEKIEVKLTGTPLTFKRYTLNSGGASVGWTFHPEKAFNAGLKALTGFNPPVKNLYQVGHWSMSPGGTPAGYLTGKIVSGIISKRMKWGV